MNELFKNTHDALRFAFNFSSQQYATTPMAKMMKSGILGSGAGLTALDGAGQAGMIRREVSLLSPLFQSCIVASYSARVEECKCCGGEKMLEEYRLAISTLSDWSLQWLTGLSVRSMRITIVRAYFERGISVKSVAEKLRVPSSSAYDQKKKIWDALSKLDKEAKSEIADRLEQMCLASEASEDL